MLTGDTTDVTATLTDLERKLVDLERELSTVAGGPTPARPASPSAAATPPAAPGAPPGPGLRVEDLRGEIADLVRFRDQLEAAARELVTEYDRLVNRLRGTAGAPPSYGASAPPAAAVHQPPAAPSTPMDPLPPAVAAGLPAQPPAPTPQAAPAAAPAPARTGDEHDDTPFVGAVEVDAGPFADIATLQSFEQALAHVEGAEDVYVKSFEGNRALIDVRLSNQVPLVRQLRERLPVPMTAREASDSRLTIDVQPAPPDGT